MSNDQHTYPAEEHGPFYSGRDVRQGDIVLRKPWERAAFIAGLVGAVVLAFVIVLVGVYLGREYGRLHANGQPAQVGMIQS